MFVNLKIDKINEILISCSQIVKHKPIQIKTNLHWKVVLPMCLVLAGELTPLWRDTAFMLWNRAGRGNIMSRRKCLFLVGT
jgi:hypothetical protein